MTGRRRALNLVPALLFIFALSLNFSAAASLDLHESPAIETSHSQTLKRLIVERSQSLTADTFSGRSNPLTGFWLWNEDSSGADLSAQLFSDSFFRSFSSAYSLCPLYILLKMLVI